MAGAVAKIPGLINGAIQSAKPKVALFGRYARVELIPPTPAEIPKIVTGVGDLVAAAMTFRWRKLTMRQAWLNTVVAAEVFGWFWVGECIGKGRLIGYKVHVPWPDSPNGEPYPPPKK